MKYLMVGVLAAACSAAALADSQPAPTMPSAERIFDCGPDLRAEFVLRATPPSDTQAVAYNGVVTMQVNGGAADPMTLRFVNEKVAGRTIDALVETCRQEAMDLVFSTNAGGAKTDMLTVTVQGNRVTVR